MDSKEEIIRKEIISTAQQLFQHYGFTKTTMEDIAKAMKKGKSTLYYYFKSKEEIFEAVVITEVNEINSEIEKTIEKGINAEDKLKIYLSTTIGTVKSKINLYGLLKEEAFEDDRSYCAKTIDPIKLYNDNETKIVKDILLQGIENGEFNKAIINDTDIITYVIITALRSIIIDLALSNKNNDNLKFFEKEKIEAISNMLIKGLK